MKIRMSDARSYASTIYDRLCDSGHVDDESESVRQAGVRTIALALIDIFGESRERGEVLE